MGVPSDSGGGLVRSTESTKAQEASRMKVSSRKLSLPITFPTAQLNTLTPAGLGAPGVTPTAAGGLCPQAVPGQERWG